MGTCAHTLACMQNTHKQMYSKIAYKIRIIWDVKTFQEIVLVVCPNNGLLLPAYTKETTKKNLISSLFIHWFNKYFPRTYYVPALFYKLWTELPGSFFVLRATPYPISWPQVLFYQGLSNLWTQVSTLVRPQPPRGVILPDTALLQLPQCWASLSLPYRSLTSPLI